MADALDFPARPSDEDGAGPAGAPAGALVCPEPDARPDLWPAGARRDPDGALVIGGARLTEVQRDFGSPSYLMDRADVRGRAQVWAAAMAEEFWDGYGLAGGDAYYAAKALACADVVRTVTGAGMGVDTASLGELTVALRAGADPARVGLHGNNKLDDEIAAALDAGLARIVLDSLPEVARVEAAAAARGARARVMIRLKTGIHAGGNEYIATSHEDQKFGVSIADGGAAEVVRAVLAAPHLELVGLHTHTGSQIQGTDAFAAAARLVLGFREAIAREHGVWAPEVDLGGGVGIAYSGADPVPTAPVEVARALAEVVREACASRGLPVPRVSVEPGRSVVGPAGVTLYRVGTLKDVSLEGGAIRRYVSVDGGMSDNIRPALYGARYTVTVANRRSAPGTPAVRCRVVGRHCESGDIVVHDVDLPADLRAGDLLAVPATGAYGWSMASNYNYLAKPGIVGVEDGVARWMVRPQTLEDLLALDAALL